MNRFHYHFIFSKTNYISKMERIKSILNTQLFSKIDADTLSLFRLFTGIVFVYEILYYIRVDYVYNLLIGPQLLFKYPYLEFLQPMSSSIMYGIQYGLLIAALLILVGLFQRWASAFFFLGFSYFFYQDATIYNNHLYLFSMISFFFIFIDGSKKFSIKSLLFKSKSPKVAELWELRVFQFLLFITYFFGGIAKIKQDWINGSITNFFIEKNPRIADSLQTMEFAQFIAISGLLFDLIIPFLLFFKKTRWLAVIGVLLFNYTNSQIFFTDIGVFPFFMVVATVLFFEPGFFTEWQKKLFPDDQPTKKSRKKLKKKTPIITPLSTWQTRKSVIASLIMLFVLIQVWLPLRHFYMTYNPDWTGVGSRFAWRMKMQTIYPEVFKMSMIDPETNTKNDIDINSFLTANQKLHLLEDPRNLIQLAKHIEKVLIKRGFKKPQIMSQITASFNGRPAQYIVYPDVDLTKLDERSDDVEHWVYPLSD